NGFSEEAENGGAPCNLLKGRRFEPTIHGGSGKGYKHKLCHRGRRPQKHQPQRGSDYLSMGQPRVGCRIYVTVDRRTLARMGSNPAEPVRQLPPLGSTARSIAVLRTRLT